MLRTALLLAAALSLGCAGSRGPHRQPQGLGDDAARETLRRLATALVAGDLETAEPLLSARWRARYTPARLGVDWAGAGPAAREAADAVLAALAAGAPLEREGGALRLRVRGDRAALLVAEGGAWRVDALE